MPRMYALLVGINEYQAVTPLHGCVADITAVESLLRERVAAESLDVLRLADGAATRANIVDGFRTHLGRATDSDVALFYYCGHGSQEACPPEWRLLEPSGKNQTLVPVDARVGDTFDLADKELTALIADVAAGGAHVVTIFDSCHSGGVTRGVEDPEAPETGVARMTAASKGRLRTLADYLEEARALHDPERIATHGPPAPRHVAIAACQHNETAKEFPLQPPRRGAFTSAFEEAVRALGPAATYTDLVTALRMKVRDRAREQLPNLYAAGGARGSESFLGGQAARTDLTVDIDAKGTWWLSAGALDGIPSPARGDVAEVAIHPRGAFDIPGVAAPPIATATVDAVLEDRARLRLTAGGAGLDPAQQYLGVITRLGTPALHVIVHGPAGGETERVRSRLAATGVHYALVDAPSHAPVVTVRLAGDGAEIVGEDGAPLEGLRYDLDEPGLAELSKACTHLARWYGLRDRTPLGSRYNEAVTIELVPIVGTEKRPPDDRGPLEARDGAVRLQYEGSKGPRVQVRLRNGSNERLYVALLDLDDTFGAGALFADWIPAGGVAAIEGGKAIRLKIMEWRDASVRTAIDWFKLFAATTQFDVQPMELKALLATRDRAAVAVDDEDEPEAQDDSTWGTTRLKVETVR